MLKIPIFWVFIMVCAYLAICGIPSVEGRYLMFDAPRKQQLRWLTGTSCIALVLSIGVYCLDSHVPLDQVFHAIGYIGLIAGLVATIVIGSKKGWLKYPPHP